MIPHRIAYVVKRFPKLSETFILEELIELTRRGIEVRICSLLPSEETIRHPAVERSGLMKFTTEGLDQFANVLKAFRPDLIHAHFATEPTDAARALSDQLDVPYTFTAHGYDIYRKPPADFYERAAGANAVITVSRANADYIHNEFGCSQGPIYVVSCGVDTSRFRPSYTTTVPPLLLCVARMSPVKNLQLLLRACALLEQNGVDFRCVLIGEGRCRSDLEQLRRTLSLKQRVFFSGALNQEHVIECLRRATVSVLTSHSEGMPVCLMEAAACGIPAVATDVGGVAELVQDGVTGIVVPTDDTTALASSIGLLLGDAKLAKRMGRAARLRAESLFSVKHQVDAMLSIWSQTCGARVAI